ncbi:hypothetical protein G6L99_30535 [Agrobacterium rhizogenes]|uniref:hypothetical protein n=1 Tax=Rhizobium rhizogenes TaxID=359 RepID=UPI001571C900|nr:hypothetical protein [Rhizobium rhizogenes]NTH16457.1 hypothetical protein [Rhizobium rhizogenes]
MRYYLRKNHWNSYWSVIDIFTGRPAIVDGFAADCLTDEEANYMVDLMNLQDLVHENALKPGRTRMGIVFINKHHEG